MKQYTIIGGVNGAGKSSLTGALKYKGTDLGPVIDVDKLAAGLGGKNLEAGKIAVQRIDEYIDNGISFTQETTLAGHRPVAIAKKAKAHGFYIRLCYVGLNSCEESVERITNRVAKGGHDIPEDDIVRRFNNRFDDLLKVLPFCDEASFFDNNNGFIEVAQYRNGEIIPIGDYRPKWIVDLQDFYDVNLSKTAIHTDTLER